MRWIRAHTAGLVSVGWAVAIVAMSPAGAELALADGPSAARSKGAVLGGLTSNGWPVVAELTPDGHRFKRIVGAIVADCSQGGRWATPSEWRDLRISRSGAFKTSYRDTDVFDDGTQVTYVESFAGRINRARTRLTARWSSSTTLQYPDGTVDVCDTGVLKLTLH
jgi:hypothetical protein